MKLLKKLSKKATAFALAMALLFGMNTMSAFAATPDPGVSPQTVINPWHSPVTVPDSHKTSGIGVRAGETIRLDLNIIYANSGQYDYPMYVDLIRPDGTSVEMITYSRAGNYSHTFTSKDGGTYYILFSCRYPAQYRFNYSVTF